MSDSQIINGVIKSASAIVDDFPRYDGPASGKVSDSLGEQNVLAGINIFFDGGRVGVSLAPFLNLRPKSIKLIARAFESELGVGEWDHFDSSSPIYQQDIARYSASVSDTRHGAPKIDILLFPARTPF
jgi:hypothetical protein